MGLRTIVLKLHKPTRAKLEILEQAISNYNKAFWHLMHNAYVNIDEIREKARGNNRVYSSITLSNWVSKALSSELNRYDVEPFKDSLKLDMGMTLASYLRLKDVKPKTSFPRPDHPESPRPLYFCRYDLKRSYCLLYDKEKDRYFAKLYLMNSRTSRTVTHKPEKEGKLEYIHKKRSLLENGRNKESFIIIPLEFGKWQEGFLKAALVTPEILRTAKLIKKNNEYLLAVSIDTGNCEKVESESFLGVSRGLKNRLNYTLVDSQGLVLESGPVPVKQLQTTARNIQQNVLHCAANAIVELAGRNKAQVIVENLLNKGDRVNWIDADGTQHQPVYKCHDYNQMVRILEYKLPAKGLPSPIRVSAVDIFYTCQTCGARSKKSRLTKDIFICTNCGTTDEVDFLGSLNLSRKLISYNSSAIRVKVSKTPDGVVFSNNVLGLMCFSSYGEDQLAKLRSEIQRIVRNVEDTIEGERGNELSRKLSIVKKFRDSSDILDMIEYV